MITRRKFLQTAEGLAASAAVKPLNADVKSGKSAGKKRPNFLIFMPDQHQGQWCCDITRPSCRTSVGIPFFSRSKLLWTCTTRILFCCLLAFVTRLRISLKFTNGCGMSIGGN